MFHLNIMEEVQDLTPNKEGKKKGAQEHILAAKERDRDPHTIN